MTDLPPKQERALRAARAAASVQSRKNSGTKVYISQFGTNYIVKETKDSGSIYCYKNGNEISI